MLKQLLLSSILKHFLGEIGLSRIFCCVSAITVFGQTDYISDCYCSDSALSNIFFTLSDEMSFVHASILSTYVLADVRLKVSAMKFYFRGLYARL